MIKPDPKRALCQPEDFVEVVMVRDEHSAAPGQGCDLDSIPPPDRYLVDLAMKAFRIDPQSSGARQQLARVLRKKWRSERPGRRNDDMLLAVEISLSDAKAADTASAIAEKMAPQFRYLDRASLVQKVRRLRRKERKRGGG